MKVEKITFKQIDTSIIMAVIVRSGEYPGDLDQNNIYFHKKDNNYISANIIISNRLYTYLIENKLVTSLKSCNLFSAQTYMDCTLQLTTKTLLDVL